MEYSPADTATVLVDHEALTNMLNTCSQPGIKAALIGFNEYSKHLLNLVRESIVTVYDQDEWKTGICFQGCKVAPSSVKFDINIIIICDFKQLYGFTGGIRALYQNSIPVYYPPRLDYKSTVELDVFSQEAVYTEINQYLHLSPPSMMESKKLYFLAELMRVGLKREGDIVEMGVYQGGSVWYLAHILNNLGEHRHIYMFDVFETHMSHPNATMCKNEIERRLKFYPHCHLLEGLVNDERLLSQVRGKSLCFAHYDLGFHYDALDFLWEHLVPGSPLVLDNYGHMAIVPWDLDQFFAARNAHVMRLPWSEQGVVFKP